MELLIDDFEAPTRQLFDIHDGHIALVEPGQCVPWASISGPSTAWARALGPDRDTEALELTGDTAARAASVGGLSASRLTISDPSSAASRRGAVAKSTDYRLATRPNSSSARSMRASSIAVDTEIRPSAAIRTPSPYSRRHRSGRSAACSLHKEPAPVTS